MAETENNRWAKGASRAKYTARHYGRNYSVITEQFECCRLCFYATIESLYGANHFTETVRKLFYDAYCIPIINIIILITFRNFFVKCSFMNDNECWYLSLSNKEGQWVQLVIDVVIVK